MPIIFLIWQPHQQILNLYTIDAKYWLQRRSAVLTMNSRMIGDIWNLTGNLSNRDQTFYKKQQQRIQERQMRKVCTDYRQNEAGETYHWETLYKTTKKQHQTKSGSKQREWTGRYRHNFKKEPRTEGFPSGKTTPPFSFHSFSFSIHFLFICFHFLSWSFASFYFRCFSFHFQWVPSFFTDFFHFVFSGFLSLFFIFLSCSFPFLSLSFYFPSVFLLFSFHFLSFSSMFFHFLWFPFMSI